MSCDQNEQRYIHKMFSSCSPVMITVLFSSCYIFNSLPDRLPGFYCEDWALFGPTGPCAAGYYCIAGTLHGGLLLYNMDHGVDIATSNNLTYLKCAPPQGVNFQNPDGNFSTGVGGACPKGRYCPEGTGLPLPCPPGTFSNRCGGSFFCCCFCVCIVLVTAHVCVCVCMCCNTRVVAVFTWRASPAAVRVPRVGSVALQVSLVHLDRVRRDFTVQEETQHLQVKYWVFILFMRS